VSGAESSATNHSEITDAKEHPTLPHAGPIVIRNLN